MISVNGNDIEWKEGMTISDVFKAMGYDYALIMVSVDDEFVSQEEYETWRIKDHSDVRMMHLCHGG